MIDLPFALRSAVWEVTTLAEAARRGGGNIQTGPFGSQLHAADYVSAGVPSVMPQNIGDNRINVSGIARITEADAARLGKYRLLPGDIVYSRRGDVERRALVRSINKGWLCGTGCLRVRLGEGHVHPEYLAFYLGHRSVRDWVVQHAVGATMPNLNTGILGSLPVVLPPLTEQLAIASVLSALDDKIELNRRMNETLEAMAQAVFRDWFIDFGPVRRKLAGATDPVEIMGGVTIDRARAAELSGFFPRQLGEQDQAWEAAPFLSVAKLVSGGTPKTDQASYWNGPIAWASAKDVSQCGETFLIVTERSITELGLDESSTKIVSKYSTVVVARGATTGRFCMFGRDIAMNQTCYGLESRTGTPFWLNCAFRALVTDLVQSAHGSVFDTITTATFENATVVRPPDALLRAFEDLVQPLFGKVLCNLEESQTLAETRDYLLPRLMSGEVRVGEAAKEIAA